MARRFFNLLWTICGIWIAILVWNWFGLLPVLGAPIILILMAAPVAVCLAVYYVSGV
jgi:hypothetical protein